MEEYPDYEPSEMSLSYPSGDDSDDSGYTQSPDLPASPEYHPGSSEDGDLIVISSDSSDEE